MKTIYPSESFNIYDKALCDNIQLPKIDEAWKAVKEGYSSFIIVPGAMRLDEIIARAPDFIRIHVEEVEKDELRKTVERPEVFYTLALSNNEIAVNDYPNGSKGSAHIALSRIKEMQERLDLKLTGLTINEYIWAQLFQVFKTAKFRTNPNTWGLDHECAVYLLDEHIVNQKTLEAHIAVGFWSNNDKPGISIVNGSKGIKNFMPVVPRLAINFSGEKNE